MIKHDIVGRWGNVLDQVKTGIIVQQVNAQGVMGSGIAKEIRERWPIVWTVYSKRVVPRTIDMGAAYMGMMIPVEVQTNLWVVNIVGQQFYGRDKKKYTSYDALDTGFQAMDTWAKREVEIIDERWYVEAPHVHFPLIGCGLGGGDWEVVRAIICHRVPHLKKTLWLLE